MTVRRLRYSVGNEHNPGDPWGRSELSVEPDGALRLDHHFSRVRRTGAWTGYLDASALDALWRALDTAGFPVAPTEPFVAGATLRVLTVEAEGVARQAILDWHKGPALPGYGAVFDILDGVIRQLSGDTVTYPTTQPPIVRDVLSVRTGE